MKINISIAPLFVLATIILAILKLGEIGAFANISWMLVFLPVMFPFLWIVFLFVLATVALVIGSIVGFFCKKKKFR